MNNEENTKNKGQGFSTHLLELRTRILRTLVILVFVFVLAFIFAENIYQFLINPYYEIIQQNNLNRRLIFTALQEAFITYIKVAFLTAFIISSPIFLIEIWKFVAPGLYNNEKKAFLPYLVATPILFIFGALLVYYFIMPIAIKFFMGFEVEASNKTMAMQLEAKVNEYLFLIMRLIFAFGLSLNPSSFKPPSKNRFCKFKLSKGKEKILYSYNLYSSCNTNTSRSNNANRFSNTFIIVI